MVCLVGRNISAIVTPKFPNSLTYRYGMMESYCYEKKLCVVFQTPLTSVFAAAIHLG